MSVISLNNEVYRIENIYCIGRNYAAHIEELNHKQDQELMVFLKPNSAASFPGTPVCLPHYSKDVQYEAEIVVLIGQNSAEVVFKDPLDYIAGYGLGIDMTARDIQKIEIAKSLPWLKSKGFKQSALLSEFILKSAVPDPEHIRFALKKNGDTVQVGDSAHMLYSIATIIETLNQLYGLKKGDIIFTGTPKGVGPLSAGDELELILEDSLIVDRFLISHQQHLPRANEVTKPSKGFYLNHVKNPDDADHAQNIED